MRVKLEEYQLSEREKKQVEQGYLNDILENLQHNQYITQTFAPNVSDENIERYVNSLKNQGIDLGNSKECSKYCYKIYASQKDYKFKDLRIIKRKK